jgi:hypothetical protein
MGTSGPARNLEQAMKNATDSSVIQWTGFVDGAALFKSFDKVEVPEEDQNVSLYQTFYFHPLLLLYA